MSTLDASLLLAHFNSNDAHHANATDFLAAHVDEDHFINPLNLAEVLVGPARTGVLEQVRQAVAALGVVEQPFPVDAATELAELRARTRLKIPGCCVLLTARQTGTPVASFDDRLRRDARGLGLTIVPWSNDARIAADPGTPPMALRQIKSTLRTAIREHAARLG